MTDRRVNITLSFATDANPADVAISVGAAITSEVPDELISMSWHGFNIKEAEAWLRDETGPSTEDTSA